MSRLQTPLRSELGARTATALEKHLGMRTVGDLLRHYPRRWAPRGELTALSELREGDLATVVAEVSRCTSRPMRQRRGQLLEAVATDGVGSVRVTFFLAHAGQVKHVQGQLAPGRRVMFAGKVERYGNDLQLVQPQFELLDEGFTEEEARARAAELIPIYPATAKVPSWSIARSVRLVLDTLVDDDAPDPLPAEVRERRGMPGLVEALRLLHAPTDLAQTRRATERFKYEEAFVLQVVLAQRRAAASVLPASPYPRRDGGLLAAFDERLPFTLTAGQREVGEEIAADLARTAPMNRLLQGEVGSGKTLVALRAMLQVVDAGAQAAMLAPTEVLAVQHHRSLVAALGDLAGGGLLGGDVRGTRVTLLTGSMSVPARRKALLEITTGEAGIVVGTHALIQDAVDFFDLGLVVVDEQHRFGVEQRDALRAKSGTPPHALVMTATPIPRTVAMTVFGDLEVSTLTELPAGRSPITTVVVPTQWPAYVERSWARLREEVLAGRQAYVVCPRIGGEHASDAAVLAEMEADVDPGPAAERQRPGLAAAEVLEQLRENPATADLRLALLHGRLPAEEKDAVMTAFAAGEVDVLVATTVVEVGVDVPNATVMVIMDADRFGLSQLHQLRGRIGRGGHAGLCLLVTETADESRQARLRQVSETSDGFALAQLDLEGRREGDVLGAAQSGRQTSLRLLRVTRDEDVIARAREDATALVAADPHLDGQPLLVMELLAMDAERQAYLERA